MIELRNNFSVTPSEFRFRALESKLSLGRLERYLTPIACTLLLDFFLEILDSF